MTILRHQPAALAATARRAPVARSSETTLPPAPRSTIVWGPVWAGISRPSIRPTLWPASKRHRARPVAGTKPSSGGSRVGRHVDVRGGLAPAEPPVRDQAQSERRLRARRAHRLVAGLRGAGARQVHALVLAGRPPPHHAVGDAEAGDRCAGEIGREAPVALARLRADAADEEAQPVEPFEVPAVVGRGAGQREDARERAAPGDLAGAGADQALRVAPAGIEQPGPDLARPGAWNLRRRPPVSCGRVEAQRPRGVEACTEEATEADGRSPSSPHSVGTSLERSRPASATPAHRFQRPRPSAQCSRRSGAPGRSRSRRR